MARISPALLLVVASSLLASAAVAQTPPSIVSPTAVQRDPGQLLLFNVSTSDADGHRVTLAAANVPTGARFLADGNGNGSFSWRPVAADEGFYLMTLIATDNGSPMMSSSLDVSITIGDPNLPPVLDPVGDQETLVGTPFVVPLSATDPEGDGLVFSTDPVLNGSLIQPGAYGMANFVWTPDASAVGNHALTFMVSDGASTDSESVVLTVGDVNVPPVLEPIGNRQAEVDVMIEIVLMASDPDGDGLAFSAEGLPVGVDLVDAGNGTAQLVGMTATAGLYTVTVTVTDDGQPAESASETFEIDVQAPAPPPPPEEQEPDLALLKANWKRMWLMVMGEGALPGANVDIHDATTGAHLGSSMADAEGVFLAQLRPFVAPCSIEARSGDEISPVVAVMNAPADCGGAPPTRVRSAVWKCRGGLFVEGHRAPPRGSVRLYDAGDSGALLGSTTASSAGEFRLQSFPPRRPHSVRVSVESGGAEWMLDPVSVRSTGHCHDRHWHCGSKKSKHHHHRGHHDRDD